MSTARRERVGQVLLGEHRLERLVRSDGAVEVYEATSTIDQGSYTVALAPDVSIETSAMGIEGAIERAARHATGVRGVVSLLRGAVVSLDAQPCLVVVRRGAAGESLPPGPLPGAEIEALLGPIARTLTTLHDQGVVHGVVGRATIAIRQGTPVLDLFGLGSAAEAASGARGARDVVAPAYRAAELRGERPSSPGPWTDLTALGLVALELATGREGLLADGPALPSDVALSPRLVDLAGRLLDPSPARRPTSAEAVLREIVAGLAGPVEVPPATGSASAPVAAPSGVTVEPLAMVPEARRSAGVPAPRASQPVAERPGTAGSDDSRIETRQRRLLAGLLLAGGLLMVGGIGVAMLYTMRGGGGWRPAAPTATGAPTVKPAVSAPTAGPAGSAAMPTTSPRGPLVSPSDHDALVPVDAENVVWGDRDAFVTVVMFGDLTCPFSARAFAALPELVDRHGSDLRLVYRHYPSPARPDAEQAAEAGAAVLKLAGSSGWWAFVPTVPVGKPLDGALLEQLAAAAGAPAGAVTTAWASHDDRARVEADVQLGRRLGVRGTPVFLVNGRRLDGLASERLEQVVADELRKAQATRRAGVNMEALYQRRVFTNVTTGENDERRGR